MMIRERIGLVFIKSIGKALSSIPERYVQALCSALGNALFYIPNSRRTVILSNLTHAFPEKSFSEIKEIGRQNCCRLMEYGAFALAVPYFSEERCREIISIPDHTRIAFKELIAKGKPILFMGMHTTLNECNAILPLFFSELQNIQKGIIYRPFNSTLIDEWVKISRERFGCMMLSRKEGLITSSKLLRDNQILSMLFDQNAGKVGTLITMFGQVCSATELPGIFVKKFPDVNPVISNMHRTQFWRVEYQFTPISKGSKPIHTVLSAHQWLENYLSENSNQCADWLWSHKRWKTQNEANQRLRISHKKDAIFEDLQFRNMECLPKKVLLWVRLPNWLGDIVMALPAIRAIQKSRPDFSVHLLVPAQYAPMLSNILPNCKIIPLPKKGLKRFLFYWKQRKSFIDTFILFTNSQRGDIEAWLSGASQRFGISYNKKRPLLTNTWQVPQDIDWSTTHQSELNAQFVKYFGLNLPISNKPFQSKKPALNPTRLKVCLLFGSDNLPEKRWPAASWKQLIAKLLALSTKVQIYLLGTANDYDLSLEIIQTLPREKITNLTGETNILEFSEVLSSSDLVISNDSGGLHLANLFGIPTIGLYGPTNPLRTSPFYDVNKIIIQPNNCPATGGSDISEISVDRVFENAAQLLQT